MHTERLLKEVAYRQKVVLSTVEGFACGMRLTDDATSAIESSALDVLQILLWASDLAQRGYLEKAKFALVASDRCFARLCEKLVEMGEEEEQHFVAAVH
jgi:hypothetical protein